jgi:predicted LPLAT superfamily acyltransferase
MNTVPPRRFAVNGVFWRQLLRWGMLVMPAWLEPLALAFWSLVFLLWGPGRRGVMRNLTAIVPGSNALTNFCRTYLVFWNFACTILDNVRFKETRIAPDWEIAGGENFRAMIAEKGGAILLTAHMGNYDLGAHIFAETSARRIVMVRAPEADPETREYEENLHERTAAGAVKIDFSTRANELALDLLHALQRGEIVAIQGDRATPGITTMTTKLFGKSTELPVGPFALAMTARVPIYPLFVVRRGRRRYRLVVAKPLVVERTRDRTAVFERALDEWTRELETVIRASWFQWFAFEPFSKELA